MSRTFHLLTFGCKVNQYETQSLREAWLAAGAVETDSPALADVVCINTCAVTTQAVSDARKAVRRIRREAPQARLLLTGCAAARVTEDDRERAGLLALPGIEAVYDPASKPDLLRLFDQPAATGQPACKAAESGAYPPFAISDFRRSRPVLKVQDGCTQGCAYCIVPLTRGPSRSRAPGASLAELRRLLDAGFREIMISGINLRQYGHRTEDGSRENFWDLLHLLDSSLAPEWAGRARLRLSSIDPAQLDARALDVLADTRLVCPHLHLSLQSGSLTVLRRMGRGHYTPEQVLAGVDSLARVWPAGDRPGMALGADLISGFPGETDAEHAETLALIRALPLTYAHVFPYSERPGTRAAAMSDPVAGDVRRTRAAALRGVISAKRRVFLENLVGADCSVAMEPEGHGVNEYYVPCRPESPMGLGNPQDVGRGLVPVTVVGTEKGGLLVQRR